MPVETEATASEYTPFDNRSRALTGMRTTGELHLGHYVGALEQWLDIQKKGDFDCYFLLADVQALTTHAERPGLLTESVRAVVQDWLAVGLDPDLNRIHFVLQSQIPERYELSQQLMMVSTYSEVMRNPTLKEELERMKKRGSSDATMGFMSYPVDQAADIYMVSPTPPQDGDRLVVPVGEDQESHIELSREIARRFNRRYGPVFVEAQTLVGRVGRLPGIDGKEKMGKSEGNAISLSDDEATVTAKVMKMYTDRNRVTPFTPGDTVNNPVFIYLRAFDPNVDEVAELTEQYQRGSGIKDVQVKQILARRLNEFLDPIRQRRVATQKADIRDIVVAGTQTARELAVPVVESVREKMHLVYPE